jgi:hypothetical protein
MALSDHNTKTISRVYGMKHNPDGTVNPHGMRANLIAYNLPRDPYALTPYDASNRPALRLHLLAKFAA